MIRQLKTPAAYLHHFRQELYWWGGAGLVLYSLGLWLDKHIFQITKNLRYETLDSLVIWAMQYGLWLIFGGLTAVMIGRIWTNENHYTHLVPAFFSMVAAGITGFILQAWVHINRPFLVLEVEPLLSISSSSFPSIDATIMFAMLIPLYRVLKPLGILWGIFAFLYSLLGLYAHVHFPTDIAAGIFIGGLIGATFSHKENHHYLIDSWHNLEFRRQTFHFCTGFACVFLHWMGFLRLRELAIILVVGLIISLWSQYKNIPVISAMLRLFDRDRDKDFPGRGAFYFLLSVFICLTIFPLKVAYAVILILAVGDSINHLIAAGLSPIKIPWNKKKSLTGVLMGIASGTFAAQFFVGWAAGLLASTIGLIIETIPIKIGSFYIDDNLTVPISAGAGIVFLQNPQAFPLGEFLLRIVG